MECVIPPPLSIYYHGMHLPVFRMIELFPPIGLFEVFPIIPAQVLLL